MNGGASRPPQRVTENLTGVGLMTLNESERERETPVSIDSRYTDKLAALKREAERTQRVRWCFFGAAVLVLLATVGITYGAGAVGVVFATLLVQIGIALLW